MSIVRVIDFETTGLEPTDQVCEVGFCDFDTETQTVGLPQSWLCRVNAVPPSARAAHHITAKDTQHALPFDPVDARVIDGCDYYAMHNAGFDCQFWSPPRSVICTYKSALRVWPTAPSHSNAVLRYWLEDAGEIVLNHAAAYPPHRAGSDAYVTAHILKALLATGATGRDMVAWTKLPRLLPACPIGKFRGKQWAEVEAGFLSWMTRVEDLEPDFKWNAQQELDRRNGYHAACGE